MGATELGVHDLGRAEPGGVGSLGLRSRLNFGLRLRDHGVLRLNLRIDGGANQSVLDRSLLLFNELLVLRRSDTRLSNVLKI